MVEFLRLRDVVSHNESYVELTSGAREIAAPGVPGDCRGRPEIYPRAGGKLRAIVDFAGKRACESLCLRRERLRLFDFGFWIGGGAGHGWRTDWETEATENFFVSFQVDVWRRESASAHRSIHKREHPWRKLFA